VIDTIDSSDLDAADIYIDGKLVGNAPATFILPAGPHRIEVKDQSQTIWQRELEVLADSDVKLKAVLPK
jgi:hypothetical protein